MNSFVVRFMGFHTRRTGNRSLRVGSAYHSIRLCYTLNKLDGHRVVVREHPDVAEEPRPMVGDRRTRRPRSSHTAVRSRTNSLRISHRPRVSPNGSFDPVGELDRSDPGVGIDNRWVFPPTRGEKRGELAL